jgi:O-antigen/teichoic acid export membrane protein
MATCTVAEDRSSGISLPQVARSVIKLGTGEGAARLAMFALYGYVSRFYGVGLLGVLALSQAVAGYVTLGTDQGLCLIAARIVAKSPATTRRVIGRVVRKRFVLCIVAVSLGSAYALWGPIPTDSRLYVLGFALSVVPYALSLDWVAWGLGHMGLLGAWRSLVGVLFVGAAVVAMHITGSTLLPLVLSKIGAAAAGAVVLWAFWHFLWSRRAPAPDDSLPSELATQLRWGAVLTLGVATIFNQLFNGVDTLILAGMTSETEVGRYNAAYKILGAVLIVYYLVTQSLYPSFSASQSEHRLRSFVGRTLVVVGMVGGVVSVAVCLLSRQVLVAVYGRPLASAAGLLRVLSIALPLDCCTSLLGIFLVSRGHDKLLLKIIGAATVVNVGLNLTLIPRMQALGSAWATVLSYVFLLLALLVFFPRRQQTTG